MDDKIIKEQKEEESKSSKAGIIFSIIFILWFLASIIAMACLSKINGYYTVMVFGQYFLVFGLALCLNKDINNKRNLIPGILFILVGIACIIIPYLMMEPYIYEIVINWDGWVIATPVLTISPFAIGGLALILVPIIKTKLLKSRCTIEVAATIVDYAVTKSDNGGKLYCPIYEFQFNGQKYEVKNNVYTNIDVKPIGTLVNLKINPDNPKEFLGKSRSLIFCIFMGIIFFSLSIVILMTMMKN